MSYRASRALVLFAMVAGWTCWGGWAVALAPLNEPQFIGVPGSYVTLPFRLQGEGEYTYEVRVDEPWAPLADRGTVRVDGAGYVSVSFRVPWLVAGTTADVEVVFTNRDDPSDVASAYGTVEVAAQAGIDVLGAGAFEAELGRPYDISLVVSNRGNLPDRITLQAEHPMWDVRLSHLELTLAPGESHQVDIVLSPLGEVSTGYRVLLEVEAFSQNDPELRSVSFVEIVFVHAALLGRETEPHAPPRLTLSVRSGVSGGVTIEGEALEPSLGFDATPRIAGELSDYVDMQASFGALAGTLEDPFHEVPSKLDVALIGEAWDASASIAEGRYAVTAGSLIGDWRVSGGVNATPTNTGRAFGVSVLAASQLPELDLQISARTRILEGARHDGVGAWYRTALGEGVVLGVGTDLVGTATDGMYRVDARLHESLTWQTQAFDVTQSYSGVPLAGLHNLGLSGGLRSTSPFGVRASTSLQLTPATSAWRNSVTVDTAFGPGARASVTGLYRTTATAGGEGDALFGVLPEVSFRFGTSAVRFGVSLGYLYTGVLRGDIEPSSAVHAGASVSAAGLSVSASAAYERDHLRPDAGAPADPDDPVEIWELDLDARYDLGRSASLRFAVEYDWERPRDPAGTPAQASQWEVSWLQRWHKDVASLLAYERDVRIGAGATQRDERVSLAVEVSDLAVTGLSLTGGYSVSSQTGLLTGMTPLRHAILVRLGYTFSFPFDTPDPVVGLFGGRRGGGVSGTAYVDRDLDGVHDSDEPVVAGLEVRLGGEAAVTDDAGGYEIRVPSGTHRWYFVGGMPTATDAAMAPLLEVTEDSRQQVDLPFVPVSSLGVTLFDDVDGDGLLAAGEPGIAFGGVLVDGPVRRTIRVDGRGNATVTGLVPGTYTVAPDPSALPARYRVTTEPVVVVVREGERPAPVTIGAGAPPPERVTTFTGNTLVMLARVDSSAAPAGADVTVQALVTGIATDVVVEVLANDQVEGPATDANGGVAVTVPLVNVGSRWTAVVRLPSTLEVGPATLRVRATGPDGETTQEATQDLALEIVDEPLFTFDAARVVPSRDFDIHLRTWFHAENVFLLVGDEQVSLASGNGYDWNGFWRPRADVSGTVEAIVVVDGAELGHASFEVPVAGE
ncbi:MAG: hypothetical protein R6W77_13645 [Trueperaceae bacterium]